MGWGGDYAKDASSDPAFAAPKNDLAPPVTTEKYSYVEQSPGYTRLVIGAAWKKLTEIGAEFSDMFVEKPATDPERQAREYYLSLDNNEQAALAEVYVGMQSRVGCF